MMQKWEYFFATAYLKGISSQRWEMSPTPEKKLISWGEITTYINELGAEGWELVSTTSIVYPEKNQVEYNFSFKRPKE